VGYKKMLKFKLDQLMATSLIALVVGSSAIADQTPLSVPRYRFEAVKTYNALKAKADAGDEVAQKVLSNYNGDNISKDLKQLKMLLLPIITRMSPLPK